MEFVFNDGGRKNAGFKGDTGDCAVRAIAIATGIDYQIVYDDINKFSLTERNSKNKRGKRSNARTGVYTATLRRYMSGLNFTWIPAMLIGSGCKVHLKGNELPKGVLIASLSKHVCCVINGVIHDTYDCSRNETRCVYGYWIKNPVRNFYEQE